MKNVLTLLSIFLLACQAVSVSTSILITNVLILDGTGKTAFAGAVRIQGNKIVEVGNLKPKTGEKVLDGAGKMLSPGFIDTHSHHNRGMFEKRGMDEVVSQGVTTIVVGQDGGSYYPLRDFWKQLDSIPIAVNVASYAGHNTIRRKIMSVATRPAEQEDIDKMKKALRQELKAGALGLSTGLEYDPGIYSNRDEILQLASVVAAEKRRYISHIRSEDVQLWQAIDEIINIGKTYKIPVEISHMKIAIVSQWGKADSLLPPTFIRMNFGNLP
jgi:N-acyl-D-amino-acid deacylase